MSNVRNIWHTLVYQLQQYALFSKLSGEYVQDVVFVGQHDQVTVSELENSREFVECFGLVENVAVAGRLERASVVYVVGKAVKLSDESVVVISFIRLRITY